MLEVTEVVSGRAGIPIYVSLELKTTFIMLSPWSSNTLSLDTHSLRLTTHRHAPVAASFNKRSLSNLSQTLCWTLERKEWMIPDVKSLTD